MSLGYRYLFNFKIVLVADRLYVIPNKAKFVVGKEGCHFLLRKIL